MWAGSQFEFHAPVRVGNAVARSSTITIASRPCKTSATRMNASFLG